MPAVSTLAILGTLAVSAISAFKSQKGPKPPEPPPPEPPVAKPEVGEADATQKRRAIKAGRQGDILTGSLAPRNVGKKRLLGGT
jgi:hypothetical protein